MRTMSESENCRASLSSIDEIVERDGDVVLTRNGRPLVRMVPLNPRLTAPSHADYCAPLCPICASPARTSSEPIENGGRWPSVYVDTSALAKWYLNEAGSDDVEEYLRQACPGPHQPSHQDEMRSSHGAAGAGAPRRRGDSEHGTRHLRKRCGARSLGAAPAYRGVFPRGGVLAGGSSDHPPPEPRCAAPGRHALGPHRDPAATAGIE